MCDRGGSQRLSLEHSAFQTKLSFVSRGTERARCSKCGSTRLSWELRDSENTQRRRAYGAWIVCRRCAHEEVDADRSRKWSKCRHRPTGTSRCVFLIDFDEMGGTVGGVGSGPRRPLFRARDQEEHLAIDVRVLHRAGALSPGEHHITLGGAPLKITALVDRLTLALGCQAAHEVLLATTPCNYGGQRPWFRCPGACCGRVAKLYFVSDGWQCRSCAGLRYRSQRLRALERGLWRAKAIREGLGGPPSLLAPFPSKPPRMRWQRYDRLKAEAQAAESHYLLRARATARGLSARHRSLTNVERAGFGRARQ
jgi:hypothetical protein